MSDVSGHGVYPEWVGGKYGTALRFNNGDISVENRVVVYNDGSTIATPDAYSLMAWVKLESDPVGDGDQWGRLAVNDSIYLYASSDVTGFYHPNTGADVWWTGEGIPLETCIDGRS